MFSLENDYKPSASLFSKLQLSALNYSFSNLLLAHRSRELQMKRFKQQWWAGARLQHAGSSAGIFFLLMLWPSSSTLEHPLSLVLTSVWAMSKCASTRAVLPESGIAILELVVRVQSLALATVSTKILIKHLEETTGWRGIVLLYISVLPNMEGKLPLCC